MVEANVPLLAMPSGSILQFLLMTVPLLCVYLYFLFLAYERPSIADPDNPRYDDDRIRLTDILYAYLVTLVPFCSLIAYMLWFVPMRRGLSSRYEKDAIIILGDVKYTESYYDRNSIHDADAADLGCAGRTWRIVVNFLHRVYGWMSNGFALRNNYAYLTYDLERVANHPACDYEERRGGGKMLSGIITKRVRVYHRYPRERVSILVFPEYPYSGQPKTDMEADWASFAKYVGLPSREDGEEEGGDDVVMIPKRDRSVGVIFVAIFWVCFLVFASYYVVTRIELIDDVYEDEDAIVAWRVFKVVLGGIVPGVAIGGTWIRWKIYERWMLRSGTREKSKLDTTKDDGDEEGDRGGGSYIQMS